VFPGPYSSLLLLWLIEYLYSFYCPIAGDCILLPDICN
jgi:hypothetical protein